MTREGILGDQEKHGGEWARGHSLSGRDGVEGSCPRTGTLRGWGCPRHLLPALQGDRAMQVVAVTSGSCP